MWSLAGFSWRKRMKKWVLLLLTVWYYLLLQGSLLINSFCLNVSLIVTIFLEKPFNITCCYCYQLSAPCNVRSRSRNICDPIKWLAFSTNPTRPRSCCQFLPWGSQPRGEHCFTRQCDSWRSITSDNIIQTAFNSFIIFVYASLRMVGLDIYNKLTSFLCLRILILSSQSSSHKQKGIIPIVLANRGHSYTIY